MHVVVLGVQTLSRTTATKHRKKTRINQHNKLWAQHNT